MDGANRQKLLLHFRRTVRPVHKKGSQSLAANSRFTDPRKTRFSN